jgi:hypothetical protein
LHNFERALGWLAHRYDGLLSDEEQAFIQTFVTSPHAARAMLVRLIMRRGPLFRVSKIRYEEIGETAEALAPWIGLGWVDADPIVSIEQICSLLTKRTIATYVGFPHSWSKEALRGHLQARHPDSAPASQWAVLAGEPLIQVKISALCAHLQLLFFGNWHQHWNEFVLSDLGIFKYERVAANDLGRAFDSRDQIESFYSLFEARQALEQEASAADVLALLPSSPIDHEWLEERRAKLQFALARREERSGELTLAADLYAQCCYPGAKARLVRVLERQGRVDQARDAVECSADSRLVEAERELLERARRRLTPKPRRTPPARAQITSIELALDEWERVEESVAQALHSHDAPVVYVENLLINALFGLWCWDAIFHPVAGAFFHPFQRGPADLWSPMFVERRREIFERAFLMLDRNEHTASILATYQAKVGTHNPFVFWEGLTVELIELALHCIPEVHLRCMFERMLADLERNSSGFPDLVQFYPNERRYRFMEVKGPGDRLQDHQRRWMKYFAEHEIPAMVCHVSRARAVA